VTWAAFDAGHTPNPWDGSSGDLNPGEKSWTGPAVWAFFSQFTSTTPTPSPTTSSPNPTTPSPNPTTPSPAGSCRVSAVVSPWNTGLTEQITVTNTGTTAVNGWSLAFTLPGGQTITSGWNATYSPSSGQVTARNVSYNAAIAPNTSVGIGLQATHTGNTAGPAAFRLNGADCTVA
jgi:cellulase/cellobiase CelA1